MQHLHEPRCARLNDAPERPERAHVLYWMTSARRTRYNYGLQRALAHAARLRRPLIVLEALRLDHRWASARTAAFVAQGMADNAAAFARGPVAYHAYVEPALGAGRGLLAALAADAAIVVTDHYPCFFLPAMARAAAARLEVAVEAVDSNGLMPLSATPASFSTAHSFRRFLQKNLLPHLHEPPLADPLAGISLPRAAVPEAVLRRWPATALDRIPGWLPQLPVDQAVAPVACVGGAVAAGAALRRFLDQRLDDYGTLRNQPEPEVASGLSPYLHFGHLSAHEAWAALAERERWRPGLVAPKATGSREGWWGLRPTAEAFLDELVTWRELGYVFCHHNPDTYYRYDGLPDWARATLEAHRADPRPRRYDLDALEGARTHDGLWNAAQNQLVTEGRIHNYLRMLWGKKVLEWSDSPERAFDALVHLNNKYALDGRDPNSYSGIAWTFGRFDRPWGPVRPIFGTVRYMSSDNTARKLDVKRYRALYEP